MEFPEHIYSFLGHVVGRHQVPQLGLHRSKGGRQ